MMSIEVALNRKGAAVVQYLPIPVTDEEGSWTPPNYFGSSKDAEVAAEIVQRVARFHDPTRQNSHQRFVADLAFPHRITRELFWRNDVLLDYFVYWEHADEYFEFVPTFEDQLLLILAALEPSILEQMRNGHLHPALSRHYFEYRVDETTQRKAESQQ